MQFELQFFHHGRNSHPMSVLVIGLNPAVDEEWRVDSINWDEKTIVREKRSWAGGKPPNVGRWLRHLGVKSTLLMPLGGAGGKLVANHLRREKVKLRIIPLCEETRTNVMVTQGKGKQLRFNPPGPVLSRNEWEQVFGECEKELKRHKVMICSGSLPAKAPTSTHAKLVRLARKHGVLPILDCDGPALQRGVKAKPFLVKPNLFELAGWCGRRLNKRAGRIAAAREMSSMTGSWVMVSADKSGALLVNEREKVLFIADAPKVNALNTVGAGDAMLAAVARCISKDLAPDQWLREGIAAGTAYVRMPAGELPKASLISAMRMRVRVK
tara:strand:- start:3083 stop:4060 length:978 start_codon:yes stop_codon:yes gene_type:complete